MIYSSLDSSHRDESNDSKIIPIGAIFAEIAIFAKFRVGLGRVKIRSSIHNFQLTCLFMQYWLNKKLIKIVLNGKHRAPNGSGRVG